MEPICDSDISSDDESVHSSDLDLSSEEGWTSSDDSDIDYIPEFKKQNLSMINGLSISSDK